MNKNHKEILKRNLLFFFENIVVDKLKKFSTQKEFGYHGLEHTELVALRAIDIAVDGGLSRFEDVVPVVLAAALHDSARKDDGYNENHGPDAAKRPESTSFLKDYVFNLNDKQIGDILSAVKVHTVAMPQMFGFQNYITKILCDADRCRLSWDSGYNDKFFFTSTGKKIAKMKPDEVVLYLKRWKARAEENKIPTVGRPLDMRYVKDPLSRWVYFTEPLDVTINDVLIDIKKQR